MLYYLAVGLICLGTGLAAGFIAGICIWRGGWWR
jgi:hypothetical protein